jgi:hypothetical protein
MALRLIQKIFVFFIISVFLSGMCWAGANLKAEDRASAADIIDKYIQACGGNALKEIETEKRRGTLVRGNDGHVPLEIISKIPGKWHYAQTFAWGDRVCYGFDGITAWVQDTRNISGMSVQQRLDMQLLFDAQAPLNINELYPVITLIGSERIDDRETDILEATSHDGIRTRLVFDRDTGLLLRAGGVIFEDYRQVGRVKRPFRIVLGIDQGENHRPMTLEISDIQHNAEVADSLFHRPSCILTYQEAPLYKSRNRAEVAIQALEACVGDYKHPFKSDLIYSFYRQKNHLMLKIKGTTLNIEIVPESETGYFIRFLGWEFRFLKDSAGIVTHVEMDLGQKVTAEKIK